MNKKHYDVIVIGRGTAGVVAAIQAGRTGNKIDKENLYETILYYPCYRENQF